LRLASKTCLLLIAWVAVLLCLAQVAAQSGRRGVKKIVPEPVKTQETTTPEAGPVKITSLVIAGHDIDPEMKEVWSNDTSLVAEACSDRLKEHPKFGLEIIYAGKLTKTAAVERAKQETSAYVLWFGYRSKLVGLDYTIHYLDYIVLHPQTAKTLTEGRVYPARQRTSADPGGIIRVPTRNTRKPETRLLEIGGREIADRIKNLL
jgi:hypothetical protein